LVYKDGNLHQQNDLWRFLRFYSWRFSLSLSLSPALEYRLRQCSSWESSKRLPGDLLYDIIMFFLDVVTSIYFCTESKKWNPRCVLIIRIGLTSHNTEEYISWMLERTALCNVVRNDLSLKRIANVILEKWHIFVKPSWHLKRKRNVLNRLPTVSSFSVIWTLPRNSLGWESMDI